MQENQRFWPLRIRTVDVKGNIFQEVHKMHAEGLFEIKERGLLVIFYFVQGFDAPERVFYSESCKENEVGKGKPLQ